MSGALWPLLLVRSTVVHFDPSVTFGLMALPPHVAPFTAPGLIIAHLGDISIGALPLTLTGKVHLLSHGAYIEVFLLIVVQVLQKEGVVLLCAFLLFMEVTVLDITLYFL